MKKSYTNTTYAFTFSFFLVMAFFASTHRAHADTYMAGPNSDIKVNVNLDNGLIYTVGDPFSVTGQLESTTATVQNVDLSAIANGMVVNLFPAQPLSSNDYPIYNTLAIIGATSAPGSFQALFQTGVEPHGGHELNENGYPLSAYFAGSGYDPYGVLCGEPTTVYTNVPWVTDIIPGILIWHDKFLTQPYAGGSLRQGHGFNTYQIINGSYTNTREVSGQILYAC